VAVNGWEFWELTTASGGELAWLGMTRPIARSTIDRKKVWTLIPNRRLFIANWFVTEDHMREEGALWVHENIDITEARNVILNVPQPTQADLARITRPESCLTLDQIDRHTVEKVMGKGASSALRKRQ
jgi:hypothetical protein